MWTTEFYRDNKKAIHWLVLVIVLARLLEQLPLLESWDRACLDLFARLHVRDVPSEIYIVEITDEDYQKFFHSESPLKAAAVAKLIVSIEKMNPAVIGVDLDTSSLEWAENNSDPEKNKATSCERKCQQLPDQGTREALANPNIIWATVPTNLSEIDKPGVPFSVDCPLGGERARMTSKSPIVWTSQMGLVILPEDDDGRVRGHRRDFPPASLNCAPSARINLEPFDVAVKEKCEEDQKCKEVAGLLAKSWTENVLDLAHDIHIPLPKREYVNLWQDRYAFRIVQAGEFLSENGGNVAGDLMKDHIVLLGGAYAAARDRYWTPFGDMPGVELLANGVNSAAAGYILPSNWPPVYILSILVDFLLGCLVIWLSGLFKRGRTGEGMLAVVGLIVPFYLLYKFYSSNIWLGAVPVVAGVFIERIHALYEDRNRWREKVEELEKTNRRLASSSQLHVAEREHKLVKFADGTVAEDLVEREEDSGRTEKLPNPDRPNKDNE